MMWKKWSEDKHKDEPNEWMTFITFCDVSRRVD